MAIKAQTELQSHKDFLKYQVSVKKGVHTVHTDINEEIDKVINRNTNAQGKIDKYKLNTITGVYLVEILRQYRNSLSRQIKTGVHDSSIFGVRSILSSTQPERKATAWIWQNASDKIKKNILTKRGIDGLNLSERIWKVSDTSTYELKKIINSGILQGDSAVKMSRSVRGYLVQPSTLRGRAKRMLTPGRGTYKSAYKNALRLTVSETNKAYIDGQNETARLMGTKLKFHLSPAHPRHDVCDPYAGMVFNPGEGPLPLHPWCMCYYETVTVEVI